MKRKKKTKQADVKLKKKKIKIQFIIDSVKSDVTRQKIKLPE